MTDMWMGYAALAHRRDLARALREIESFAALGFASDGGDLRLSLLDEEPGTVGAIVGLTDKGVSDVNLAAALVRDGRAERVVLVARDVSGSLRSRARQAGVDQVIDLAELSPASGVARSQKGAGGRLGEASTEAGGGGRDMVPSVRTVPDVPPVPSAPVDDAAKRNVLAGQVAPDAQGPSMDLGGVGERSPVLCFVSGRGGVGKTTLAATCASVAGLWGMSCALVDLDLSCGNLSSCFSMVRPIDLSRIGGPTPPSCEAMGRACVRCADGVFLWGPCERPEMAETVMPHVGRLLGYLASRYDLVVVDTSTTFTDAVAQAAQQSDRLFVVHDGARGSASSLGRTSALAVRLGVARTRIARVENLSEPRSKFDADLARAEAGLEGARAFRVFDGGEEVSELLSCGHTADLVAGGGRYVESVSSLLSTVLGELGCVPDKAARAPAGEGKGKKGRFSLFGHHREAV